PPSAPPALPDLRRAGEARRSASRAEARGPCERSRPEVVAGPPRDVREQLGQAARTPALVEPVVPADDRAAHYALCRHEDRIRRKPSRTIVDDRQGGVLVRGVEREPREDLSAEVARPDAVAGEPQAVVDGAAGQRAEEREVAGRNVDRSAPRG